MQCGRILDILKLWVYFKGNGWKGINEQVVKQNELAQYVKEYVKKNSDRFLLAIEDVETFNVCFWYIPKTLKK